MPNERVGTAASTVKTLAWYRFSRDLDAGDQVSIASCSAGVVKAYARGSQLFYRVGAVDPGTGAIEWGNDVQYTAGHTPAVAVNDAGTVIIVHLTSELGSRALCYFVGAVDFDAKLIKWAHPGEIPYDTGQHPSVALNNLGEVVEVHATQGADQGLWGNIGVVLPDGSGITFSPMASGAGYDNGRLPRVSVNDDHGIVEVHQTSGLDFKLYARVGTFDTSSVPYTITWKGGINYDRGVSPAVALANGGDLVELHQSQSEMTMSYWIGKADCPRQSLEFPFHEGVGWGVAPAVGLSSTGVLAAAYLDGDLESPGQFFYATANLTKLTYGLSPEMLALPYNQITFAGAHNAYSNDSPRSESHLPYRPITLNNHLSVVEQLDAGIRCLDFEVHPARNVPSRASSAVTYDAIVYHGSGTLSPVAALVGCSSLNTLFGNVLAWVRKNAREIVTIYCDYQDGFNNDGSIIQVLKDTGLFASVYNLNHPIDSNNPWPTLQTMIDQGQTVMLFGLQQQAAAFSVGQNLFDASGTCQNPQPTWSARVVSDLDPRYLCLSPSDIAAPLFRDSHFCSRRAPVDAPYSTAGNPNQAAQANQYFSVLNLASAIESRRQSKSPPGIVNWIWCEFVGTPASMGAGAPSAPYGLLAAVYQLNASRHLVASIR